MYYMLLWVHFLLITVPSIVINDIKWTPEGLSVQPKVDGNFDLQNVKIKYKCGDEQPDAGSAPDAENNYSNLPHILKIKWQKNLRLLATATNIYGNTATCEADIPDTPGKIDIHGM